MSGASIFSKPVLIRFAMLLALVALSATALGSFLHLRRKALQCSQNLQRIYEALVEYQGQFKTLPKLSFYPEDARLDPDSLGLNLAPFGILESDCVCPSSPAALRDFGITYVWNVALNMRPLEDIPASTWMMVEIHALSSSLPAPHGNAYNILYADGSVQSSKQPPIFP